MRSCNVVSNSLIGDMQTNTDNSLREADSAITPASHAIGASHMGVHTERHGGPHGGPPRRAGARAQHRRRASAAVCGRPV
eukprot:3282058-Prymnesium_polylepis.1